MGRLLLLALFLGTLSRCFAAPPVGDEEALKASTIIDRYCGSCHRRSLPTAKPKALAVFDLSDASWTARMSEAQLRESVVRLAGERGPTRSTPARPDEVATVRAIVQKEILRRVR